MIILKKVGYNIFLFFIVYFCLFISNSYSQIVFPSIDPSVIPFAAVTNAWRFDNVIAVGGKYLSEDTVPTIPKQKHSKVAKLYNYEGLAHWQKSYVGLTGYGGMEKKVPLWLPNTYYFTKTKQTHYGGVFNLRVYNRAVIALGYNQAKAIMEKSTFTTNMLDIGSSIRLLNYLFVTGGLQSLSTKIKNETESYSVAKRSKYYGGAGFLFGDPDNILFTIEGNGTMSPKITKEKLILGQEKSYSGTVSLLVTRVFKRIGLIPDSLTGMGLSYTYEQVKSDIPGNIASSTSVSNVFLPHTLAQADVMNRNQHRVRVLWRKKNISMGMGIAHYTEFLKSDSIQKYTYYIVTGSLGFLFR